MLGLIKAGSTITRVYYEVPEHYGHGPEFDTLPAAARHAQRRLAALIDSLTRESGFTPEVARQTALPQVRVDLRWVITDGDGSGYTDLVVEKYTDVEALRTE